MIKNIAYTLVFFGFLATFPFVSNAETVLRTGNSVSIETDQVVENDFYAAGSGVTMSGEVKGDMYVTGGTVTVNGPVETDLSILSGTVQIHGDIGDDVRVVAGEVVIADHVGGDVFVIAGSLKILSSATIDGDVFFYGTEAEISGPVAGSVMGTSNTMRIDGAVGKNIDVIVSRTFTLGDRAQIGGDVRYESASDVTRAQNAVIEGELVRNSHQVIADTLNLRWTLVTFLVLLFTSLCLYLFFKKGLTTLVSTISLEPARAGLIGLGVLIVAPVISFLLMVTVLGSMVGASLLLLVLLMYLVSLPLLSVLTGSLISRVFLKSSQINLLTILMGAASVQLIALIPILGSFVLFVLFVLILGGLAYHLYNLI